jgi:hypothetical protein
VVALGSEQQVRFIVGSRNMNTFKCTVRYSKPILVKQILASLLLPGVLFAIGPQNLLAQDAQVSPAAFLALFSWSHSLSG